MKIDIIKLADVMKIGLSEEERILLTNDIEKTLEEALSDLPERMNNIIPLREMDTMQLRKDEILPSYKSEQTLLNAPKIEAGCIVVPKVMDEA